MKIQEFHIKNFKCLKTISMKPEGALIVIGGRNSQGKSSILESFMATVGGKSLQCEKPVRTGEKKAEMVWDFDTFKAHLTIKDNGTRELKLKNKEGELLLQPQSILDRLYKKQGFNPLAFLEMKQKDQLELFQKLVGIDFTEIDSEYQKFFVTRTEVNRQTKDYKANLDMMECFNDVPDSEISVKDLMAELERRREHNESLKTISNKIEEQTKKIHSIHVGIAENEHKIRELEDQIEELKNAIISGRKLEEELNADIINMKSELKDSLPENESEIIEQIESNEETNRKIRSNQERKKIESKYNSSKKISDDLTSKLESITEQKQQALKEARFPVEGLSFDSESILYQGLPFNQSSASTQRKVAVSMAFKLLKPPHDSDYINVVLIKDSPYLDENSLADLECIANEHDGQILLEKGGIGDECQVIIEDGEVLL